MPSKPRFRCMLMFVAFAAAGGQAPVPSAGGQAETARPAAAPAEYTLGPDDQLTIWVAECPDFSVRAVTIDTAGNVKLPLVGAVRAGGLTVRELEAELRDLLRRYVLRPEVSVTVTDFRSQPVSVLGAVNSPGVRQLRGQRNLLEILSEAGGLRNDAGQKAVITRRLELGRVPLPGAADDRSGKFSVAEVDLGAVTSGRDPSQNLIIRPHDVISVTKARMVYVIGEVTKTGGFVLSDHETISVLQAVALAGGLTRSASGQNAKILRYGEHSSERVEVAVDLKRVLSGKDKDVKLSAEDILFVPSSAAKKAGIRAAEAILQTATGIVIWRSGR